MPINTHVPGSGTGLALPATTVSLIVTELPAPMVSVFTAIDVAVSAVEGVVTPTVKLPAPGDGA